MNIMKGGVASIVTAGLLIIPEISAAIPDDNEMGLLYEYQLDQLLNPTAEQIAMEKDGAVIIYDGLKDSDIRLALDSQQERMESMMFINVIWTDEEGKPLTDPETGEVLVDDDC